MNIRPYILFLIFGSIAAKAQIREPIKLSLDTVICDTDFRFKDIFDSSSIDNSVILSSEVGNRTALFIAKRTGSCWRIFTCDNRAALSNGDSIAFVQMNGQGLKELLIFDAQYHGSGGSFGGNSTGWTDLLVVDLDHEMVLFQETISAGGEFWTNHVNINEEVSADEESTDGESTERESTNEESTDEESIQTSSMHFECNSHVKINKGRLTFRPTCNTRSSGEELSLEEKTDLCSRCIDGTYELKNNKFVQIK